MPLRTGCRHLQDNVVPIAGPDRLRSIRVSPHRYLNGADGGLFGTEMLLPGPVPRPSEGQRVGVRTGLERQPRSAVCADNFQQRGLRK